LDGVMLTEVISVLASSTLHQSHPSFLIPPSLPSSDHHLINCAHHPAGSGLLHRHQHCSDTSRQRAHPILRHYIAHVGMDGRAIARLLTSVLLRLSSFVLHLYSASNSAGHSYCQLFHFAPFNLIHPSTILFRDLLLYRFSIRMLVK